MVLYVSHTQVKNLLNFENFYFEAFMSKFEFIGRNIF